MLINIFSLFFNTAQWTDNLLKTLSFEQLCIPIVMHLKDKELCLLLYLPVLWTINNVCVFQQFAQTERIMECHSDPLPLHNTVWVVMQYNILSLWHNVIIFKAFHFYSQHWSSIFPSDSDRDVKWSVHYIRQRRLYLLITSHMFFSCMQGHVCVGGFVLPFSLSSELFLSVRLQMLPSAHLGDWAVRCERDPRQPDWNKNKAWLHAHEFTDFQLKACNYLQSYDTQQCSFPAWRGCRSVRISLYMMGKRAELCLLAT